MINARHDEVLPPQRFDQFTHMVDQNLHLLLVIGIERGELTAHFCRRVRRHCWTGESLIFVTSSASTTRVRCTVSAPVYSMVRR